MSTTNYNFYNELTNLMDISGIIHNEQSRLDKKSVGIKNALDSQNRLIFLNQSYANRMKEYSFMIMIIAFTIVIIVFTLIFKNYLPDSLVNIIVLIVGSIGGIWALLIYLGIQNRDNVDFDKVYSLAPDDSENHDGNVVINSKNTTTRNMSNILNYATTCAGQECCGQNTLYDFVQGQCLPSSSGFTSMEQAYNNGEFTGNVLQNYNFMGTSLIFSSYP